MRRMIGFDCEGARLAATLDEGPNTTGFRQFRADHSEIPDSQVLQNARPLPLAPHAHRYGFRCRR